MTHEETGNQMMKPMMLAGMTAVAMGFSAEVAGIVLAGSGGLYDEASDKLGISHSIHYAR